MPSISANNLTVQFGDHKILDDITFDVQKGDVVAIVGPNGSGKTTLLKVLMGFLPYTGSVKVLDEPPHHLNRIASRIGYVPQALNFDRTMPITVNELLSIFCRKEYKNSDHKQETLNTLGVDSLLNKKLGVLSGGEFQRVLLALALINKPEVLFLDEPTAGIDVEGAGEIYDLIQELRKSDTMTIMMVSHDIDVVYKYSDTVLCLNHKLVCKGTPSQAITKETLEMLYGKHQATYEHEKSKEILNQTNRHV